ncbi:MAG: 3-hydroxyacyl-CoA dehydrogenase, partial [Betaproteobacteria bacterium]|nr:3-hydroxyacyl-CoA dehydrogenase [Betaproteobacteria bacterium]
MHEKGRLTDEQLSSFSQFLDFAEHLHDLDQSELVIEAVVENLEVKKALFAQLENFLPPSAVIVTNTSSLSIT